MQGKRRTRSRKRFFFSNFNSQETVVVRFIKRVLLCLLLGVDVLVVLQALEGYVTSNRIFPFVLALSAVTLLTAVEGINLFVAQRQRYKMICYALDVLAEFAVSCAVGNDHLLTIYIIVLTEFYLSANKMFPTMLVCACSILLHGVTFWVTSAIYENTFPVISNVTRAFSDSVVIFVHFAVVNVAIRFYRQYVRLKQTLKELDESKAELQKAYDGLAAKTALEERQRIAKDIHDTAGHSITTVIMQTEAAKLIVDSNPEEAKSKIIAANLQAKHALEELRDSVHLLSGLGENATLKEALTAILRESSDGTGITVRSEIDEINASSEKARFVCNALKEGISNGIRHGGATAFWFECKQEGEKIAFLLSDNGRGVVGGKPKIGFGLSGMQKNAEKLGGTVSLYSEAEEGFELRIELPVDEREREIDDGKEN